MGIFDEAAKKDQAAKKSVVENQHAGEEMVQVGVYVTAEQRRKMKLHAVNTGESVSEWVRRMVETNL